MKPVSVLSILLFILKTRALQCYVSDGQASTQTLTYSSNTTIACGSYLFTCATSNSFYCTQDEITAATSKYAYTFLNSVSCSQMYANPNSQYSNTCCCAGDGCNLPGSNQNGCANSLAISGSVSQTGGVNATIPASNPSQTQASSNPTNYSNGKSTSSGVSVGSNLSLLFVAIGFLVLV